MKLMILGIRGVPASHGGFETFAEQLSPFLAAKGWDVTVFCQIDDGRTAGIEEDKWQGVRRVHIASGVKGSAGSVLFDIRCILACLRRDGVILILGYNTGFLAFIPRLFGRSTVVNMDGIEWKRPKWSRPLRAWFWLNEWAAAWGGSRLVADHPSIKAHLTSRVRAEKIAVIPYCAEPDPDPQSDVLARHGLEDDRYWLIICRLEPENNILEIVRAFCARPRGCSLVVLGTVTDSNAYHRAVQAAGNAQVKFVGAIYDHAAVGLLRARARGYCHGHTVGGTNPSLVEALAYGSAVIAHDNVFNRWTAGAAQFFFSDAAGCDDLFTRLDTDEAALGRARAAARIRFAEAFTYDSVMSQYERLLAPYA